jgi:hypothetical protein
LAGVIAEIAYASPTSAAISEQLGVEQIAWRDANAPGA